MAEKEQAKPFAPAGVRSDFKEDDNLSMELNQQSRRRKHLIMFCGCLSAWILILSVIVIVLAFTVFHVRIPKMKLNSVQIEGLDLAAGSQSLAGENLSVIADVSVKNPNVASFKYHNATTTVYYGGVVVGSSLTPPGHVKADRTRRMNVTVGINVEKMMNVSRIGGDLSSGALTMSSFSRIEGKVKILFASKKHVVVRLNCTVTVDINSQGIRDQECRGNVSL